MEHERHPIFDVACTRRISAIGLGSVGLVLARLRSTSVGLVFAHVLN